MKFGRVAVVSMLVAALGVGPGGVPPAAAQAPTAVVDLYGAAGTLPPSGTLPSGQSFASHAVGGFGLRPGKAAYFTTRAHDGTLIVGTEDQHESAGFRQTSDHLQLGAFTPSTGAFASIDVRTNLGNLTATNAAGQPRGADIADVEAVPNRNAVAFTVNAPYADHANGDRWPVLGMLAKDASGAWKVKSQWTAEQLRQAISREDVKAQVCPTHVNDCGALAEMSTWPGSSDVVIGQYFDSVPRSDPNGHSYNSGRLLVLRVSGNATAGYTVAVRGTYQYPTIVDPGNPAEHLSPAVREVKADPTTRADGTRRFAVSFDLFPGSDGNPLPQVIQEFSYDPADADPFTAIEPVSAPVIPGGESRTRDATGRARYQGYGTMAFDRLGNLWVATSDTEHAAGASGASGQPLAVFRKVGTERRLVSACGHTPGTDMSSYTSPGSATVRVAWGRTCAPDHRIVQARDLSYTWGLIEDPSTSGPTTMVLLSFTGMVMPIRFDPSNASFSVGAIADTRATVPIHEDDRANFALNARIGAIGPDHRFWFPTQQLQVGASNQVREVVPQYMTSVHIPTLMAPASVALPATAGAAAATVQAEASATVGTSPGTGPGEVMSLSYEQPCVELTGYQCPGSLGLAGPGGFRDGVPAGTSVRYRVTVPNNAPLPATYVVTYRVMATRTCPGLTFPCGAIDLADVTTNANAPSTRTSFQTYGFQDVTASATVTFTSAGTKTLRISAPTDGEDWILNSFTLARQ